LPRGNQYESSTSKVNLKASTKTNQNEIDYIDNVVSANDNYSQYSSHAESTFHNNLKDIREDEIGENDENNNNNNNTRAVSNYDEDEDTEEDEKFYDTDMEEEGKKTKTKIVKNSSFLSIFTCKFIEI
jgi:hypothetical protein